MNKVNAKEAGRALDHITDDISTNIQLLKYTKDATIVKCIYDHLKIQLDARKVLAIKLAKHTGGL